MIPHTVTEAPRSEETEGGPVRWIRRELEEVLFSDAGEAAAQARVTAWLQGNQMPPVGDDQEPFLWLLDGLPPGGRYYEWVVALAKIVGKLLDQEPDRASVGRQPERFLYNLLALAAGLDCPNHLFEPLWRMYERCGERVHEQGLSAEESRHLLGTWHGLLINSVLMNALASNQVDNRFESLWLAMTANTEDPLFPSRPFDAFEAVVGMPPSAGERGTPAVQAMGTALSHLVPSLSSQPGFRSEFRALIQRVYHAYPAQTFHRQMDQNLIEFANRDQWPAWAVHGLRSLFVPISGNRYLIWWPYASMLSDLRPAFMVRILRTLCHDEVREVELDSTTYQFLSKIVPTLESRRLQHRYPSDRSLLGAISDSLAGLELTHKKIDPQVSQLILHAREPLRVKILAAKDETLKDIRKALDQRLLFPEPIIETVISEDKTTPALDDQADLIIFDPPSRKLVDSLFSSSGAKPETVLWNGDPDHMIGAIHEQRSRHSQLTTQQ